jgi:hypothetical protein
VSGTEDGSDAVGPFDGGGAIDVDGRTGSGGWEAGELVVPRSLP